MTNGNRIKGCFLVCKNMAICAIKERGLFDKINAQLSAFQQDYDMVFLAENWKKDRFHKVLARFPFFPSDFGISLTKVPEGIDFLYFRLDLGDRQTIRFLKEVRRKNPACRIIVEVPTYPLRWSQLKWYTRLIRFKHSYAEKRIRYYADRIVIFDDRKELYGLPTIHISNGIDIEHTPIRIIPSTDSQDIHIISVSSMSEGHGIDRVISGLGEYYRTNGQRNIVFHIVGSGFARAKCEAIAESYELGKHVIFHGYRIGSDLDKIEDICDIGTDMLGGHRTADTNYSSTLKSRRCWAKGMPIIASARYSQEVNEIIPYIFRAPADDSPIDINALVEFYDILFEGGKSSEKIRIANIIHSFAERNFSMHTAMRPVFDYINGKR